MKDNKHLYAPLLMGLLGLPMGALIGAIDTLFGRTLLWISDVRSAHVLWLVPFLALAGLAIVFCYGRWGGTAGQGMGLIFKAGHGEAEEIPLRLIPFVMVGTWVTHLFGGSAGREGVAVQIGGTVGHRLGRQLPLPNAPRIFLIAGMAAGFSGLFRTPIAATAFALEVLTAGSLAFEALLPALTASFTACTVSAALGLEKFSFPLAAELNIEGVNYGKLALLGVVFGIVGGGFAWCLKQAKGLLARKLPDPMKRIAVVSVCLSVVLLLLWQGRYCGLGTNLIHASFYGEGIYSFDWALKFALTILTLAAGFQGGEVTPLFSIGASLGVVLGGVLGVPVELAAALGYAAVFGSASNTFLAPMFIGVEVFGYGYFPHFFIVSAAAYLCNRNQSIYTAQKLAGWQKKSR